MSKKISAPFSSLYSSFELPKVSANNISHSFDSLDISLYYIFCIEGS